MNKIHKEKGFKKLICLDFDGVLHSYKSGWQGPCSTPDPPVKGAMEFLSNLVTDGRFNVCIYSSRSRHKDAIHFMALWLVKYLKEYCLQYDDEDGATVRAMRIVDAIAFPKQKPPAFLTIDDRALCFEGIFPTIEFIDNFKPWNDGREE